MITSHGEVSDSQDVDDPLNPHIIYHTQTMIANAPPPPPPPPPPPHRQKLADNVIPVQFTLKPGE